MFGLYNLLASRWGRMVAFFFLYVTEGVPLGFTATAVATQMRRQGLGPDVIGVFVGTLYLPWAWKWMIGPVVDLVYSDVLGRRRGWIVAAQSVMALGILLGMGIDFSAELKLFTMLVFIINIFGATQDVAIDALACGVLREDERGLANGLMFAGAYTGQAVGGAGVLYLTELIPFQSTFIFVAACILTVTVFVALPLREPRARRDRAGDGPWHIEAGRAIRAYVVTAIKAYFGSRRSVVALAFALLPCGPQALGLALATTLQVEIGMTDRDIASLALVSTLVSAGGCVAGGYLSDRFGRRRMLALYVAGMAIPTLVLALLLQRDGWVMPLEDVAGPDRPVASPQLYLAYWLIIIASSLFTGLMYGTRTALFMDVCNPKVAATQFTAYMAILNLVIAYSATWQGFSIRHWGYPSTLLIDAVFGLVGLMFLPWITKRPADPPAR